MTSRVCFWLTHALAFSILICILQPVALGQANVQGQWSTLSNTMPINPIHAALLSNGKVLVVAGSGNCPPSQAGCPSGPPYGPSNRSGALLLDPVSGQVMSQFSLNWDMFCNAMVLLEDGRPFIAGGSIKYDPFYGEPQAATFDPLANTFSNTPNMAHGRWYPTLLTLGDGRVMAFSGVNETGSTNRAVEFYSVDTGWSVEYIAPWTPDLYPRLHLLPNGSVFYSGAQGTSKLFNPSTNTWNTNVAKTNYSGARKYGTSILLPLTPSNNYDPKVMIMGGGNPATNTTEIIDMGASTPAWQYGPNMSQPRIEMNAVILPNGKVLALGGSLDDEATNTASLNADLYDPVSNTFSSAGTNAYPRLYHSVALLLPDATVWVAGGNPSRGHYVPQMEIYKPAYLFNPDGTLATRPSISSAPSSIGYANAFTVTTPDAANISSVVLARDGAVTHAFGMDQREIGLSFTVGNGTLTLTAPPNGDIAPPGYYMLFILDRSGVPSVAEILQLVPSTTNPPPILTSITPQSATAGGAAFQLTVKGTAFAPTSTVLWNGSNRTTTFVNPTQLTAAISAADIATAGTAQVRVFSPTPGGGTSAAQTFTINNPIPVLNSLTPQSATAGGAAFQLTVNGTGIVPTSTVLWNGSNRTTTFVNPTQLTAAISAADIATAGTVQVTVFSPTPGGGTSAAQTFTIGSVPPVVNYSGGFVAGQLALNGAAALSGSRLRLTNGGASEKASAFFSTTINVQKFTNDFTFQLTNPQADGFTFVIQRQRVTALGGTGSSLGYGTGTGGIQSSVAVKFDLYNNAGEGPDSTGLYTNAASPTVPAIDLTPSGVNLHSGNIFRVHMTYDGSTLTVAITDTVTAATATQSYSINIPGTVGGNTAYAGFSGGTGGRTAIQDILTWSYWVN